MKENYCKGETIYDGKILKLVRDEVVCSNGKTAYSEIIRHHGGAGVLCIKDNKVLLIRQYRYAYDEVIYEIPAGKLEQGEDPKEAALREFEEETGNRALDLQFLSVLYPTVGYSSEKIYLYSTENILPSCQHLDEDEEVELIWLDLEQVLCLILEGKINDAKTIAAIELYLLKKRKNLS